MYLFRTHLYRGWPWWANVNCVRRRLETLQLGRIRLILHVGVTGFAMGMYLVMVICAVQILPNFLLHCDGTTLWCVYFASCTWCIINTAWGGAIENLLSKWGKSPGWCIAVQKTPDMVEALSLNFAWMARTDRLTYSWFKYSAVPYVLWDKMYLCDDLGNSHACQGIK